MGGTQGKRPRNPLNDSLGSVERPVFELPALYLSESRISSVWEICISGYPFCRVSCRHLSLIGPNGVCRVYETIVSRILDVELGVSEEYFPQKSQSQASSMWHMSLQTSSVVNRIGGNYSQVTPNAGIHSERFMSLDILIVECRIWCISHCARNGVLILSLFLPYVRSRITASDCSQLRGCSLFT
jgi:hypothetical protein